MIVTKCNLNTSGVSELTIQDAYFLVENIPNICEIIRDMMSSLENYYRKQQVFDEAIESFLVKLKYLLHCIEQDSNNLHTDLIKDGFKDNLLSL